MQVADFLGRLLWLDGRPLWPLVEPYRRRLFERFDERDDAGRPRYNLGLDGRAKKNAKTTDLILRSLHACVSDPIAGHDNEVYLLANDKDQAGDDLGLAKKLIQANPFLDEWLAIRRDIIERRDGRGFIQILPANDAIGAHGKTYRLCGWDEIHGYRNWDIFESLQPDPHRADTQQWITSYATLHHKPGVPLFDLLLAGKAGTDPRMLFSWYAADFTTDAEFANRTPEERANPSMGGWADRGYLAQQQRRLPAHKYRRLHLNLPGLPLGSAFQADPIMDAVDRGVSVREPVSGVAYAAFVDMSGGSSDDAVLGIAHRDADGRAVLDTLVDQGARPPFDPNGAVERFVRVLKSYRVSRVVGDAYAGQTFRRQFEALGVAYAVSRRSKSELYEELEPPLNGHRAILLDVPTLEQQLLGLVWRGGRIDHPGGEHDDFANAAAGVLALVAAGDGDEQGLLFVGGDSSEVEALVAEVEGLRERLAGRARAAVATLRTAGGSLGDAAQRAVARLRPAERTPAEVAARKTEAERLRSQRRAQTDDLLRGVRAAQQVEQRRQQEEAAQREQRMRAERTVLRAIQRRGVFWPSDGD